MLALKKAKPASLNLYDDDTVKWENEGKCYCLHIQHRVPLPFSVKICRIFWVHFTSKLFQIVFFNKRENSI